MEMVMIYPYPVQSGRFPRRYRTVADCYHNPIPDSLQNEDGTLSVNPEWENAELEEVFADRKGNIIGPMSQRELHAWLQQQTLQLEREKKPFPTEKWSGKMKWVNKNQA